MAISKKQQRLQSVTKPDESAFQRLIDEGLAEPDVVIDAYGQALAAWFANGGREVDGDLIVVRPQVDPEHQSLGSRLIQRRRQQQFRGKSAPNNTTDKGS